MIKALIIFSILFILTLLWTVLAFRIRNIYWKPSEPSTGGVRVFGTYSSLLTWLKYRGQELKVKLRTPKVRKQLMAGIECAAIILWALWLGRHFLVMNSMQWMRGDWALNVQSYFAWSLLKKCGACVLWNGYFNGGAPLFTDLLAAMAHPLVVILILLKGAVNGSKLIGVSGMVLAGLAQWYWAKVLRLGAIARLWSAAMAVVGGYLIGRLESGLVEIVFSTASFSLASAAAVHLAETGNRRVAVGLGIFTGLAFLSGQGYLELAFILCICPALMILLIERQERLRLRPVWKEFVLAAGIAILISAILWVPVLHTFSNVTKPGTILEGYSQAQSIEYQPLNLVIRDYGYYDSDVLGKYAWPAHTVNYIGWIPIIFVLFSWRLIPRSKLRLMAFFWVAIILVYTLSSAVLIKLVARLIPAVFDSLLNMARFPSLVAGLVVPFILALSAWGLDLILQSEFLNSPLNFRSGGMLFRLTLQGLLILLLGISIKTSYDFVKPWLETIPILADAKYYEIISKIKPKTTQWVEPPNFDLGFLVVALDNDIKLTNIYHLWSWKDRTPPPAYLLLTSAPIDPLTPNYIRSLEYLNLLLYPAHYYAYVAINDEKIPCQASALGGNIDIDCETDTPGQLIVAENFWSGWTVKRDGVRVPLGSGDWLTTTAPTGTHHYEFRYRPWDVPLGGVLSLLGWGLAAWLWFSKVSKEEV